MNIGFTGTREGMTDAQLTTVEWLLEGGVDGFGPEGADMNHWEFHHGDCVGADEQAAHIADTQGYEVVSHPPVDPKHRAWAASHQVLAELPYHTRNRDIVDGCDVLIATPKQTERHGSGGTWYTIGYGVKRGKPVLIVWPDGEIEAQQ